MTTHGIAGSFRLGQDCIFRCDEFQQFVWQEHGFGTSKGNPHASVTLRQVHSDLVLLADHLLDREKEGDALLSDVPGKSIGVRTADCVPILLLDAKSRAIGAVHAGWRGTVASIVAKAIGRMRETYRSQPQDLWVAIGPCIRDCCYEVGPEVAEKFRSQFPDWSSEENERRKIDLVRANVEQMRDAGVPETQMFDGGLCTFCQPELFYSYRREPANPGRLMSAICRLA
jgi:polyphenol oxidase